MEKKEFEERLLMLERKAAADQRKCEEDAKKETEEASQLKNEIWNLSQRIKDLVSLADKCVDLGIKFPSKYETYKYGFDPEHPRDFEADGIDHQLGFFHLKKTYLAILNGGYNGPVDFLTDGEIITGRSNRSYDNGRICPARKNDMKRFIKEFDHFESTFLNWIDSLDSKSKEDKQSANEDKSENIDFEKFAVAIINEFESGLEKDGRSEIADSMRHIFTKYQQNHERKVISDVLAALTGYGAVSLLELSEEVDLSE